ncbi:MFS transporter [Candidatus Lokiarchaeum ossiferum]|uniref:MFS transporter n=1 Tax=Candidatus Lokiarchaeum ossiferum TaxID=2951803 RepID=UPI00352CE943
MKKDNSLPPATPQGIRAYRFYPMFLMAFFRTYFYAIYGLALPNYLIFDQEWSPSLVGTVSSITSITYILGPFISQYTTKLLGMKRTLILASSISYVLLLVPVFVANPIIVILARSLEGIANGHFWPNAINIITCWEKNHIEVNKTDYLKRFNLTWNFGLIFGFLSGYFFVFFVKSDFIAIIYSLVFATLMIPSAFLLESSTQFSIYDNKPVIYDRRFPTIGSSKILEETSIPYKSENDPDSLKNVPIIMAFGGIILFSSSKSTLKFMFPYLLIQNDLESYWVYALTFFIQVMQITGLNLISKFKKKRYGYLTGVVYIATCGIIMITLRNIYFVSFLMILGGLMYGLVQGVAQRIVIDYNKHHNSTKYSAVNEIAIGIGFGFPPIIAGLIYEVNMLWVFIFLATELSIIAIILFSTHFKFIKNQKTKIDS